MKGMRASIAIRGGYGLKNFGDDALMVAALEATKKAFGEVSTVFVCRDSAYVRRLVSCARVVCRADMKV